MCPFLQEPDSSSGATALSLVLLPLFLSYGAITRTQSQWRPRKGYGVPLQSIIPVLKLTLLPHGNIELLINIIMCYNIDK